MILFKIMFVVVVSDSVAIVLARAVPGQPRYCVEVNLKRLKQGREKCLGQTIDEQECSTGGEDGQVSKEGVQLPRWI